MTLVLVDQTIKKLNHNKTHVVNKSFTIGDFSLELTVKRGIKGTIKRDFFSSLLTISKQDKQEFELIDEDVLLIIDEMKETVVETIINDFYFKDDDIRINFFNDFYEIFFTVRKEIRGKINIKTKGRYITFTPNERKYTFENGNWK